MKGSESRRVLIYLLLGAMKHCSVRHGAAHCTSTDRIPLISLDYITPKHECMPKIHVRPVLIDRQSMNTTVRCASPPSLPFLRILTVYKATRNRQAKLCHKKQPNQRLSKPVTSDRKLSGDREKDANLRKLHAGSQEKYTCP
jgi:hypothetical protein